MVDHLGKAGVLILHGMGRQKPSYAGTFMRDLRIYLDQRGWSYADVALEAVHFAGVFDEIQVRRAPKMIPTSAWWQIITRFGRWVLTYILSDAVSYKSGGGYARVQDKVSASLKELQARLQPGAPVIIAAHSLGAMVISDYIYDLQQNMAAAKDFERFSNLKGLVTFGCNIPLFEMGHLKTKPFKPPTTGFSWDNFYSPFDVLGYRLESYYDETPAFPLIDIKIYPGCLLFWTWLSHNGYWTSVKMQKHIVERVVAVANPSP